MPRNKSKWSKKRHDWRKKASDVPLSGENQPNTKKSASFRKLEFDSKNLNISCTTDEVSGYRIIDMKMMQSLLDSSTVCSECHVGKVQVIERQRYGLCSKIELVCNKCNNSNEGYTSQKQHSMFEVNIRFVYALRCIGKSKQAGSVICGVMNIPPPPTKFMPYNKTIFKAVKSVVENNMQKAASEVINICEAEENQAMPLGISVTVDGTWMRRGYSSLYGVVTVISAETGKVLDVEVESKFCHFCSQNSNITPNLHECSVTHVGSSGSMEVSGAIKIFKRSIEKHNIMYTSYIGDGDSHAFKSVESTNPYDTPIQKLECIGHVQKRMGTRLRNLKKTLKKTKLKDGQLISGKGRLTDKVIDSLQFYYGKAIRENTHSLSSMKMAVWATYFHKLSTDESPQHNLCAKGESSWCKYNRSVSLGITDTSCHKNSIPINIMEEIKPIYRALASPELLKKCLHGRTQNTNESLNSLIWLRCPKTTFASMITVKTAVYDAVSYYNCGNRSKLEVLETLGIVPGVHCIKFTTEMDAVRIKKAEINMTLTVKDARKRKRNMTKGFLDKLEEKEGNLYKSGGY